LAKADIRTDASAELDKLVKILKDNPTIRIELSSHTDSRSSDDYNLTLSQQRADALRDYLIGKGVTEDVLLSVGYGETRPLDPALNAEAYDRNRRTEFNVSAR
jgi:outer membrane protein OmpA-like peptidoglycan-associated protein